MRQLFSVSGKAEAAGSTGDFGWRQDDPGRISPQDGHRRPRPPVSTTLAGSHPSPSAERRWICAMVSNQLLDKVGRLSHFSRVFEMFRRGMPRSRRRRAAIRRLATMAKRADQRPSTKQSAGRSVAPAASRRTLPRLLALPFTILEYIGRGAVSSLWYLAFYVLCMFRPFTGLMVLAAIVMVPISIVVYAHPGAASGMPFWGFGLMAIGLVACALAYTVLLDWLTPPGAADPFERYRGRR